MEENQFYTSIEDAKREIRKRWNDVKLRKEVESFLGINMPVPLKKTPRAIMVRCIASPDNEFFKFLSLSSEVELEPLFIDYPQDKFVAFNSDKYALCNLHFEKKDIRKYEDADKIKLINFNKFEGKSFSDIKTLWGNGIEEFHHEIFRRAVPQSVEIFNFWEWFDETRHKTEFYYLYYLSLFVCHGILFENMLMSEEEREFTEKKIMPSFKKIQEMFGVKPLILPIAPVDEEDDFKWWLYPKHVKNITDEYIKELGEKDNYK
jgi:hypothetical protein